MTNKRYVIITSILVLVTVAVGAFFTSVHGKGESKVGVVNLDAVYTQYMAPPLVNARDEMQAEFDEKSAELDEDEKTELFMEYQEKLTAMERQYREDVQDAVNEVGQKQGVDVIVNASVVLYGGIDLTDDVIKSLE